MRVFSIKLLNICTYNELNLKTIAFRLILHLLQIEEVTNDFGGHVKETKQFLMGHSDGKGI